MFRTLLLSAALALPAGLVSAQNDTGGPAPQAQFEDAPQQARGGRGGPAVEMGRGPMGGITKGFVLELGDERSLRVACGDETMAECMQAVRPVIDQMPSLTGGQ